MRLFFFLFLFLIVLSSISYGIATADWDQPTVKILSEDKPAVWSFHVSSRGEYRDAKIDVSSPVADFVVVEPSVLSLVPGKSGTAKVRVHLPEKYPPGIYPLNITFLERINDGGGFAVSTGSMYQKKVIKRSDAPLPFITGSCCDAVSFTNIGTKGLTGVYAYVEIVQDGRTVASLRSSETIVPVMENRKIDLKVPFDLLEDGAYELRGLLYYDQGSPVRFHKTCSQSQPDIVMKEISDMRTGKTSFAAVNLSLDWNEPVEIKYATLKIAEGGRILFSDSKKNILLHPGNNFLEYSGVMRANESGNYSAVLSYELGGKIFQQDVPVYVEYVPPSIADNLKEFVGTGYETVKQASGLQIVLLVMMAMIFASCLTMAIFKNDNDRVAEKNERKIKERKKFLEEHIR